MAAPFIPLPLDAFPKAAHPSLARLNVFLLELSRLEGAIRQPVQARRSDATIARRGEVQVDVSRITPSIASVVSGASTVVATPALTFGLTNTTGVSTSAVSINSAVALFNTDIPPAVNASTGIAGLSSTAANLGHRHQVSTAAPTIGYTTTAGLTGTATTLLRSDATLLASTFLRSATSNSTFALTDDATNQALTGSLGRLDVLPATTMKFFSDNTLSKVLGIGKNPAPGIFGSKVDVECLVTASEFVGAALTFKMITSSNFGAGKSLGINGFVETISTAGLGQQGLTAVLGFFKVIGASKTIPILECFRADGDLEQDTSSTIVTDFMALNVKTPLRAGSGVFTNWYGTHVEIAPTFATNAWTIKGANKAEFSSPAARAETTLLLRQLATGTAAGAHINFDNKAGDPSAPTTGDLWRNGDRVYFRSGTRNEELVSYLSRAKWAVD